MNALPDHRQFTAPLALTRAQRMAAIIASEAAQPHFGTKKALQCRRTQRQLRNAAFTVLKREGKSNGWIGRRFGKDPTTVRDGIQALARDLAKGCPESREALARMEATA